MKQHVINIPTDDSKLYQQILSFMNFLIGATPQEREVLAELVRLNHEYEALPVDKRAKFILSTDMRKEVREKLNIEDGQYNGLLSRLRKHNYLGKPVLSKEGIVNEGLLFKADKEGIKIEINLIMSQQPIVRKETKEEPITIDETQEEKQKTPETPPEDNMSAADAFEQKMAKPANESEVYIGNVEDDDIVIS